MKKTIQLLIIISLMFIGISIVKATDSDPNYFGKCNVKSKTSNTCVYDCTLRQNLDYYITTEYTVTYEKGDLKHSIKLIDSNDPVTQKKGLSELQSDYVENHPEQSYYIENGNMKCGNVTIDAVSSYSVSSSMIPVTTYYRKYNIYRDENPNESKNNVVNNTTTDNSVCGLLGGESSKTVTFIKKIYGYIKMLIPILIIVLGIVDFIKVVISGKDDDMKKAIDRFAKRIILAVVFILLPILISILIKISGIASQYDALNDGIKAIFCILE